MKILIRGTLLATEKAGKEKIYDSSRRNDQRTDQGSSETG